MSGTGGTPRGAVIFDFDGIIVDSEGLQYEAYRRVLADFGVAVSASEYSREWIGVGQGPEYAVRTYGLPIDAAELRRRKNPVYHELLRREVQLMPGVPEALARLGAHFPLGLATNSAAADTGFVLDHFDLRRHFTAVVTRELYGEPKPAPDAFLTAAASLGYAPARCVVIEDAFKGIEAAARAGCKCIAIPHDFTAGHDFSRATRVVASLDAVTVALVEELVSTDSEVP